MTTATVRQAAEEYGYAVLRLSQETQRWYTQKLETFVAYCEASQVTLDLVKPALVRRFIEEIRTRINPQTGKPISSYTVHGYVQVVKGFLNWCTKEDGLEDIVSEKSVRRIDMPKVETRVIEVFTPEQLKALFSVCVREYNDELRIRDWAILSVLIDTGIRASELTGLTLDAVYFDRTGGYLKVFGKGNKWREVGLGDKSRTALHRYITRYRKPEDKTEQVVFLGRDGRPLTAHGLHTIIARLGDWANIQGVRCSPHTFRHTFAVGFLKATGDLYRLSRVMGHTTTGVTEGYLRAVQNIDARKGMSVLDQLR